MPLPGLHLLAVVDVLAAAKKTSSSSGFFLIFLIVIAGAYLLFIAPQRRKQRAQMNQQRNFEIGDEVLTSGGIYGRVESAEGDRVALDIADGVLIEVARSSIARRVDPVAASEPTSDEVDPDATEVSSHEWDPPQMDEPATTNGAVTNGVAANGTGPAEGDWAEPWSSATDDEKGAPGTAAGSA